MAKALYDTPNVQPRWLPQRLPFSYARSNGMEIIFIIILGSLFFSNFNIFHSNATNAAPALISEQVLLEGLARCANDKIRPEVDYSLPQSRLAELRNSPHEPVTLFRNATLILGDGTLVEAATIITQRDIIMNVCAGDCTSQTAASQDSNINIIDLHSRYVTPGFVDMHSHVGVREEPQLWATEDVTEVMFDVITPGARAIDGLKPHDAAIYRLLSGGITTSLALTGAKNLISGEGVVIKMRKTHSLKDLRVNTTSKATQKPQRWLKMAMGENIKKQYEKTSGGPNSRQGMSLVMRRALSNAALLKSEQDEWCRRSEDTQLRNMLDHPYPSSVEVQTLVDVLRGDLRINVHCYEPQDVQAMYSFADTYGYNITALHHALEAHHVLEEIKSHGTMLATFSDEWGFKKETYGASSHMLKIASDAGIPIALTSDHPAKDGQFIAYEAQIGHHFGLSEELSIASLTSVPAKALGLQNRIGDIKPGFDADLVVWNRHPLRLGSFPLLVMLEGKLEINASSAQWEAILSSANIPDHPPPARKNMENDQAICFPGKRDIIITGLTRIFIDQEDAKDGNATSESRVMIVRNGQIACIGSQDICRESISAAEAEGVSKLSLTEGAVLPGLTLVTKHHGIAEILTEPSTSDGTVSGDKLDTIAYASYGLQLGVRHVERVHRNGITRLITPPSSAGFLHGVSVTFQSGAETVLDEDSIVSDMTALHIFIGDEAKTPNLPTISLQIATLRHLLSTREPPHMLYTFVQEGSLPLVVHTSSSDIIAQLVLIKRLHTSVNLIIMGGSTISSPALASSIAEAGIPVILAPWACHPETWSTRNCLPGPPLTDSTAASLLIDAGVELALGNWDLRDRYARNVLWEASWISGSPQKALDMVTGAVERMFRLPRAESWVVYDRNPFEFGAAVAMVWERGTVQRCWPDPD